MPGIDVVVTGFNCEEIPDCYIQCVVVCVDLTLRADCKHFYFSVNFLQEMRGEVDSLLLVIHNQDTIASCLEKHLQVPNSMAYEPLLDLTVQLSRDLQGDFYKKFFKNFFAIFIKLLNKCHDVEILSKTFTTLSYIFRVLINLFSPLLSTQNYKIYINKFSAEVFSFLIRKHPRVELVVEMMLKKVSRNENLITGTSHLLFEAVKGIKHQFHSSTTQIMTTLLNLLDKKYFCNEIVFDCLKKMWTLMLQHTNQHFVKNIICYPLDKLSSMLQLPERQEEDRNEEQINVDQLTFLLKLLLKFACLRHGQLLNEHAPSIAQAIGRIFQSGGERLKGKFEKVLYDLLSVVLLSDNADVSSFHRPLLLKMAYGHESVNFETISKFSRHIFQLPLFEKDALIQMMKYCNNLFTSSPSKCFQLLSTLIHVKYQEDIHLVGNNVIKWHVRNCKQLHRQFSQFFRFPLDWSDHIFKTIQSVASSLIATIEKAEVVTTATTPLPTTTTAAETTLSPTTPPSATLVSVDATLSSLSITFRDLWTVVLCIPFAIFSESEKQELREGIIVLIEHLIAIASQVDCHRIKRKYMFMVKQAVHSLIQLINTTNTTTDKHFLTYNIFKNFNFSNNMVIGGDFDDDDDVAEEVIGKRETDVGDEVAAADDVDADDDGMQCDEERRDGAANHLVTFLTYLLQLFSEEEFILQSVLECLNELNDLRLLSLKILCKFKQTPSEQLDNETTTVSNVFEVCLQAEETPATLQLFRQKLSYLQKLEFEHVACRLPNNCPITIPLKYLISQLFVNFDPMTKSLSNLIASYATNLKLDEFWSVFGPQIIFAQHQAASSGERDQDAPDDDEDDDDDDETNVGGESKNGIIDNNEDDETKNCINNCNIEKDEDSDEESVVDSDMETDDPTLNTSLTISTSQIKSSKQYFLQLFMKLYKSPCEMRKLDRSNFLTFRQRLWTCMLLFSRTCEARSRIVVPVFFRFLENEYRYNWDNPKYKEESSCQHDGTTKPKVPDRLLVMHLKLFAKFTQPKSLFLGQKLYDLYLELLKQSSLEVQRVAFSCFMTFKPPYLVPYKENFERLLDEKTFKDEIVLFSFESGVSIVKEEHRKDAVPILMRILLGKMRQKLGSDANGRMVGHSRKNIVMTFLASFNQDEVVVLLDLVFDGFMFIADDDVDTNVSDIMSGKLNVAVPLKKIQSALTSVEMIFKKLGNKLDDYLNKIFNILVCVGAFCNKKLNIDKRSELNPKIVNMLKNIRSTVTSLIIEFFELFESFNFRVSDVEALFTSLIWPQLDKLPQDSLMNPSSLMKIFLCWSQNSRYHCFFIKLKPRVVLDSSLVQSSPPSSTASTTPTSSASPSSPMSLMLQLLNQPNVDSSVSNMILKIIDNLLTISCSFEENDDDDDDDDDCCMIHKGLPIVPGEVVELTAASPNESISFGESIVVHFCSQILAYIDRRLKSGSMKSKNKKQNVPSLELSILSKLSQYVREGEESEKVVQQLMAMMSMRVCRVSNESEYEMLLSIKHLLRNQMSPVKPLVKSLATLFSTSSSIQSRNTLCDILKVLSEKLPSLKVVTDIVYKMNAQDAKRLDEPDFSMRMEAYLDATKYLTSKKHHPSNNNSSSDNRQNVVGDHHVDDGVIDGSIDVIEAMDVHDDEDEKFDDMLILLYNCLYFVSTSADRALRDKSMACIEEIIQLSSAHQAYHVIISRHLLPAIKKNLKLALEVHRHCYVQLLAHVVQHFKTSAQIQSLVALRDFEDEEKDFFLNIIHFQTHRRGKALRKLSQYLKSLAAEQQQLQQQQSSSSNTESKPPISSKTLHSYILPIILSYLKDQLYAKDSDLLDASVEALGSVVRFLPWEEYYGVLRHYLKVLDKAPPNQKLIVRLIVSVLDNFHFNLSKSQFSFQSFKGDSNLKEVEKISQSEENTKAKVDGENIPSPVSVADDDDNDDDDDGNEQVDDEMDVDAIDMAAVDANERDAQLMTETEDKYKGWLLCEPTKATHIHMTLMNHVMPKLHKCLTHKAKSDDQHRLAQAGKYAEDEEILRVPVALAMVKLLQGLPKGSLERNIHSIIVKLCFFLGSRAEDIRNMSRDTLKKVLMSLGPSFALLIFKEMKSHLHRGFQLHVLCFSIWSLLNEMNNQCREDKKEGRKEFLHPGDLDPCIPLLNEVFHKELFGDVSEEKEVEAISQKLFEAKTTKSFDAYKLLSIHIGIESLPKIVMPLKDVLREARSHKVVNKVTEALTKISQGILENRSLANHMDFMLSFIYSLTSESLDNFFSSKQIKIKFFTVYIDVTSTIKSDESKYVKPDVRLQPESCLILPAQPARGGSKPKSDAKANLHVLIEFALNLLHLFLKHSHIDGKEQFHLESIDPFVGVLLKSLSSKHTKVCTATLKCLTWLLRLPLPSLHPNMNTIVNQLFIIFKNFASVVGAGKNEHSEMADWCFKVIRVVVQFVSYHNITQEQLHVLLSYAEQDLHDYSKHATAFPLLHAILCRKLDSKELGSIMETVEEMMIKSDATDVQSKCRKVLMTYLLDYPLNMKTMEQHMKFFTKQLQYEYESGRLAAVEMIISIITVFPMSLLSEHASLMFIQLAQARLNDESSKCISLVSDAIKLLIQKINNEVGGKLRNIAMEWLKSSKKNVLMLSSIMLSLFVEVEKTNFRRHLDTLLPTLKQLTDPQLFREGLLTEVEQVTTDRLLYHYLDLFLNIWNHCDVVKDSKYHIHMNPLWANVERHLKYEYEPVRLKASQLFNHLLTSLSPDDVAKSLSSSSSSSSSSTSSSSSKNKKQLKQKSDKNLDQHFLYTFSEEKLCSLMKTFCYQLASPIISLELATLVTGNLLSVAQIVIRFNGAVDVGLDDVNKNAKKTGDKKCLRKIRNKRKNNDESDVDNDEIELNEDEDGDEDEDDGDMKVASDDKLKNRLSLTWLIRKVCREVQAEVINNRQCSVKRNAIFVWLGALCKELGAEKMQHHLPLVLKPLIRQALDNSEDADPALKVLCQEVLDLIEGICGAEMYTRAYATVHNQISAKKSSVKAAKVLQAATNPEIFAKRKMKKNITKKEAKKRKIKEMKPGSRPTIEKRFLN
ncbi:hypothetical protein HELRODRAFT_188063 [Helobdella robusta]|uniref:Small subunit processome component 20 homolog n=1 Tax=Helobdella robusta TaxID=6412 RepID=T1FPL3_HELRO|nr:hypothetical protein HELRODRAFT_188063 [Helobdella robusta]ESO12980.1 hypothetical protein HELRODRAFT_188063 [Helobdella robusta]